MQIIFIIHRFLIRGTFNILKSSYNERELKRERKVKGRPIIIVQFKLGKVWES